MFPRLSPLVLVGALACSGGDLVAIPGSTTRVAPAEASQSATDMTLHIFGDADDCAGELGEKNLSLCLPYMDRASGQVRVAFRTQVDGTAWASALTAGDLMVSHKNQVLPENGGDVRYVVIPHDPEPTSQLYVLLLDVSGSMQNVDRNASRSRMEKVRAALLRDDVADAFFPGGDVQTAVVPLVFSSGEPRPLVPELLINSKKEFKEAIRTKLQVGGGYTHLFRAVKWSASDLMKLEPVQNAIKLRGMAPVIIALTDGFNNEDDLRRDAKDVCGDNAPRLEGLLKFLDELRRGTKITERPNVFTVGLGTKAWPKQSAPDPRAESAALLTVSTTRLCGRYVAERIDGGSLEKKGVDNVSMEWIAQAGGGRSYVRKDTAGLAQAFKDAASTRYKWFELRYQVDPHHLRRKFQTRIRLLSNQSIEASIAFHPSGWIDAPPGTLGKDGWAEPTPVSRTAVLTIPLLGALLALGYLPSARYNVMRALFNRVARPRK